jgi:hypothetical protein
MAIEVLPDWMSTLEEEDISFIKNFVMSSGSLKEIAKIYGVTYPTVRLRLDRLIQTIKLNDDVAQDTYITLIKKMILKDKIDIDTAKILISEYKKHLKGE